MKPGPKDGTDQSSHYEHSYRNSLVFVCLFCFVYFISSRRLGEYRACSALHMVCILGGKKIYIYMCVCVSGFPTLPRFLPDPKHFIVDCEQNVFKFAKEWGKMY